MRPILGILYIGAWELEALLEETFCCNCTSGQIMLGTSVWIADPCLCIIFPAVIISSEPTIEPENHLLVESSQGKMRT
jgi:hypothetical protein